MTETAGLVNDSGRENDTAFNGIVETSPPEIREIAEGVRDLVYDVLPQTVEVVWPKQGSVGWGTGPKKFSEQFAYLMCLKNHVTLGFYHGGELPDPSGLLPVSDKKQVAGKLSMASLQLRSVNEVGNPALRDLIESASTFKVPTSRA